MAAPSVALAALLLGGCATTAGLRPGEAAAAPAAHDDPLESVNRGLYGLGGAIDRGLIRPVVMTYRRVTPRPIRTAISNLLQNANEPVVFVNDVLQGRLGPAGRTAARFVANSTVGVGGVFDPATRAGLPHHDNGFGSTLGRYGVGPGPYFYLPVLGPTSLRDLVGDGVDYAADPLTWARFRGATEVGVARSTLDLVNSRIEAERDLKRLQATAADPYASLRSVYLQSRQAEIKGEEQQTLEPLPDLPAAASGDAAAAPSPSPEAATPATPVPAPAKPD